MQLIKPNWSAPAHIHAYSTTRIGGVSKGKYLGFNLGDHVGDSQRDVESNRLLLTKLDGNPPDFYWLNQTHSSDLIKLSKFVDQTHNADASWTDCKECTCVVMTADCLPVLVTDQQGSFVAAIHAGWRGLCNGIVEKTITHISQQLKLNSDQILVWLGPCIGPHAFEVGDEVREQFMAHDLQAKDAFLASQKKGKWLADLHQLTKLRLARFKGLTVTESELCTFSDPTLFYSYRRDGITGRLATFIWIS
jgi:YfiH family protein